MFTLLAHFPAAHQTPHRTGHRIHGTWAFTARIDSGPHDFERCRRCYALPVIWLGFRLPLRRIGFQIEHLCHCLGAVYSVRQTVMRLTYNGDQPAFQARYEAVLPQGNIMAQGTARNIRHQLRQLIHIPRGRQGYVAYVVVKIEIRIFRQHGHTHCRRRIDELEPEKRGVYGGGCGYFSANGDMDICIALRTGIVKDDKLYVQAGGGVVYDSDPEAEFEETVNKSKALRMAAKEAGLFLRGGNG